MTWYIVYSVPSNDYLNEYLLDRFIGFPQFMKYSIGIFIDFICCYDIN